LLGRPGELVTKEELIAKVWPNTFVGPANLAVHISVLRRALGDGHAGNRYVVNIHGRGYRFVAPVTIVEGPPRLAPAVTQASDPSIWSPPMRSIERTVHHHAVELAHAYLLTLARLAADKTGVSIALVPDTVSLHQDGVSLVKLNTGENQ
jgi:DNA-binding winged helix-turn-helix (wHTH) protein